MQSQETQDLGRLALWLAANAELPIAALHDGFCGRLAALGIPLWRASLGMETLHPEETGGQHVWLSERGSTSETFYHGVETTSSYLASPLRVVDETGQPFRRRLDGDVTDMPLLVELRQAGATDYFMAPLPFLDRTRSASLSFATKADGGFSSSDIERLAIATKLLSPYAERQVLRRIAVALLDTYVGRYAGERIYSGQVRRGAVDTIEAAILMCDMRGFTEMSTRQDLADVIATLDAWFDCIAEAVEARDGEILKFMGDGLLAVFAANGEGGSAAQSALTATLGAQASIAKLNAERAARGSDPIHFATGLHVGEVAYGNVGGRTRLDFTVLGPAVNYASRLQDLAKRLDRPVLVSQDFARMAAYEMADLGLHPLRGIGEAERIFALPAG